MRFRSLAILAVVLAGCSSAAPTEKTGPKTPRIGVVLPMFRHPFFVSMRDAFVAEGKRLGVEVDVRDGQDDDQKQIVQVQALISSGVQAIVLCPRDENAAVAAVEAANRANIPVVTVNRRVNGGKVVLYVGADDADGGKSQGEELVKALGPKGGKVIYLQGTQGSSPQVSRNKGLHAAIDANPAITLAADQFTDFQEDKAKSVMSGLVQRFKPGDIQAIVAQADELALPAAEVAGAAGWKDVVVIGFNGTKPAFDAIRDGTMRATILQDPAEQGRLALGAAQKAIRGETAMPDVITKLPVVTKANMDQFKPSY
jgi:ribose transport system substrate-binding protein